MSHKHHNCTCVHETVKYCKTCYVVHCLDCNQEWNKKTSYDWSSYNTYGNSLGGGGVTLTTTPSAGGQTIPTTWIVDLNNTTKGHTCADHQS